MWIAMRARPQKTEWRVNSAACVALGGWLIRIVLRACRRVEKDIGEPQWIIHATLARSDGTSPVLAKRLQTVSTAQSTQILTVLGKLKGETVHACLGTKAILQSFGRARPPGNHTIFLTRQKRTVGASAGLTEMSALCPQVDLP